MTVSSWMDPGNPGNPGVRRKEYAEPPKCADQSVVARPETLEIRGQIVVEDRVRRGKQNVVLIGWVNAH